MKPAACPRDRLLLLLVLCLIILAGLASRQWPLPGVLAQYPGDALWASALYVLLALLAPAQATRRLALATVTLAWLIELQQLAQPGWLVAVRDSLPGRLLLGHTFHLPDLLAYVAGALFAALLDLHLLQRVQLQPAVPAIRSRTPGRTGDERCDREPPPNRADTGPPDAGT